MIYGGHAHGFTFASQMTNVETIRSERTFGQIGIRGLQVYGRAYVLDSKAISPSYRESGGWRVIVLVPRQEHVGYLLGSSAYDPFGALEPPTQWTLLTVDATLGVGHGADLRCRNPLRLYGPA